MFGQASPDRAQAGYRSRLVVVLVVVAGLAQLLGRDLARVNALTRAAPGVFSMQDGLLPEEGSPRLLAYGVAPSCIACMFLSMTASAARSSSLGLNHTNSVPGSCCTGMWPGGV